MGVCCVYGCVLCVWVCVVKVWSKPSALQATPSHKDSNGVKAGDNVNTFDTAFQDIKTTTENQIHLVM